MYHAQFSPFPPSAPLEAPITALVTFYGLPSNEEEAGTFIQTFRETYEGWERLVKEAPGQLATAAGFTLEDIDGPSGDKAKAFVVAIGWDSIDSHTSFRETEAAKMAFALLERQSGSVEIHHVEFKLMD